MPLLRRRKREPAAPVERVKDYRGPVHLPPITIQPRQGKPVVTTSTILGLPAAHAAIRTVAGLIAELPVRWTESGESVDTDTGTGFFSEPVEGKSWYEVADAITADLLIHGNSFLVIDGIDSAGNVSQCVQPAATDVFLHRFPSTGQLQYRVHGIELSPMDVIHFRALSIAGYEVGVSPLRHMARALSVGISETERVANTLNDGGMLHGFLSASQATNPDQLVEAAEYFHAHVAGRADGVIALGQGMTWETAAMDHSELELLASRQWTAQELCIVFGVPPHLIGAPTLDSETYSSAHQDLIMFSRVGLARWRRAISSALARHGIRVELIESDLTRPTMIERFQAYDLALTGGWLTRDEIRESEGLEPLPANEMPIPMVPDDPRALTGEDLTDVDATV